MEEGSKLSERSEFLDPPQANAGVREAEGQNCGRPFFCFVYFGRQRATAVDPLWGDSNEGIKFLIISICLPTDFVYDPKTETRSDLDTFKTD